MLPATILLQASMLAGPMMVLMLVLLFVISLPLFIVGVPMVAVLITRLFQKLGAIAGDAKQTSFRGQPVVFILSLLVSAGIILCLWWGILSWLFN